MANIKWQSIKVGWVCAHPDLPLAMLLQILDNGNEVLNETNNELAKCMAIRSVISDVNLILSVTGTIQCYSKTATCL